MDTAKCVPPYLPGVFPWAKHLPQAKVRLDPINEAQVLKMHQPRAFVIVHSFVYFHLGVRSLEYLLPVGSRQTSARAGTPLQQLFQ
jgi:hypothetical protein